MSTVRFPATALVVGASLAAAAAFGQAPIPPANLSHEVPAMPKAPTPPKIPPPANAAAEEENLEVTQSALEGGSDVVMPAGISVAAGTDLTPPVTITYSGSSVALTINDSGTNRGLYSLLTNTTNSNSAVYGETQGTAAGVTGINSGVSGVAGSFSITNVANTKPARWATTYGPGSAIYARSTRTTSNQPVIVGSNTASDCCGVGVEGIGNRIGLYGVNNSPGGGYGVYGSASGPNGTGVKGLSTASFSVVTDSLFAIAAVRRHPMAPAVMKGPDRLCRLLRGHGLATSYLTNSDRNAKTGFKPVDGGSVLELVSRLPITSWAFKGDPKQRHIGPMAQDFHAAFGLSGTDDKHINLSDAAGVSLVAIQEINRRLQEKDARIAALEEVNERCLLVEARQAGGASVRQSADRDRLCAQRPIKEADRYTVKSLDLGPMLTAWGHFHLWGNRTTLMRFQRASASGRPIRDGDRRELAACCRMPFPKPASRRFRRERHAGLPDSTAGSTGRRNTSLKSSCQ